MTTNPDDIRSQLEEQTAFLDEALLSVRDGRLQDISSLDGAMEKICREISALDEDIAATFEQSMADMIGKLEELAIELKSFQDRATAGEG